MRRGAPVGIRSQSGAGCGLGGLVLEVVGTWIPPSAPRRESVRCGTPPESASRAADPLPEPRCFESPLREVEGF